MKLRRWVLKDGQWRRPVLEEDVLAEIVDRLWLQARIPVWRINCPVGGKVRPNEKGIPDLIGYIPATPTRDVLPLFIETKRPGGRHRPEQTRFISLAVAAGCCAFFAECWDDVVKNLGLFKIQLYTETELIKRGGVRAVAPKNNGG